MKTKCLANFTIIIIVVFIYLFADVDGLSLSMNVDNTQTTANLPACQLVCEDLSLRPTDTRDNIKTSGDTLHSGGSADDKPQIERMTLFKVSQNVQTILAEVTTTKNIVSRADQTSSVEGLLSTRMAAIHVDFFDPLDCQADFYCQVFMSDGQMNVREMTADQPSHDTKSTTSKPTFDLTSTPEVYLTSTGADDLTNQKLDDLSSTYDRTSDLTPHLLGLVEDLKAELAVLHTKVDESHFIEQRLSTEIKSAEQRLKYGFNAQGASLERIIESTEQRLKDYLTTQLTLSDQNLKDFFTTQVFSLQSNIESAEQHLKDHIESAEQGLKDDFTSQSASIRSDVLSTVENTEQLLKDEILRSSTQLTSAEERIKEDFTTQVALLQGNIVSAELRTKEELSNVEQSQKTEISATEQRLAAKLSEIEIKTPLDCEKKLSQLNTKSNSAILQTAGVSSCSGTFVSTLKDVIMQLNNDIVNSANDNITALSQDLFSDLRENYNNLLNVSNGLEDGLEQVFKLFMSVVETLEIITCKQNMSSFVDTLRQEICKVSWTTEEQPPVPRHAQCKEGMLPIPAPSQYPYPIFYPDQSSIVNISFLCDTVTSSGGWIIIQRRESGNESFYREWDEYKAGFGSLDGDFWLGLEAIHRLTNSSRFELRIDLKYKGQSAYALYSTFSVGSEDDNYRLNVGGYSGTAGDSFTGSMNINGMEFSTKDRDNDPWSGVNCAIHCLGAWWFNNCASSNLNGLWLDHSLKGLMWHTFTGYDSVSFSEMKIRKVSE